MGSRSRQIAQLIIATDVSQKLRFPLELGAVVAIVMLLVTLALRNYETYIIRAQLSEAFNLTSTIRAEMVVYRAQHGEWPKTASDLNSSTLREEYYLGSFVDHITLAEDGSLSAVFSDENTASVLNGRQLTIRPMLVISSPGSPLFWACANYRAPVGVAPSGPDDTDIDITHLPFACRD